MRVIQGKGEGSILQAKGVTDTDTGGEGDCLKGGEGVQEMKLTQVGLGQSREDLVSHVQKFKMNPMRGSCRRVFTAGKSHEYAGMCRRRLW